MSPLYIIFFIAFIAGCVGIADKDERKNATLFLIDAIQTQAKMNNTLHYKPRDPSGMDSEYDFIIIGSGSSGSVIANRLSEVKEWNILLLEAGYEPTGYSDIPYLAPVLQFTDLNWGYLMEKEHGIGLGMVDQRISWPRGKALGGSSVINYMMGVRGNKEDYNKWERLGNPGWSYKDVFKYFLKFEDESIAKKDVRYHSKGGYLSIEDIPYRTKSAHAWVRACQEAGYEYVDYNGRQQHGVSYIQGTTRMGKRCSAEKAFLRPAKDRPNLTILTGARVTEILIDPQINEAYGVKYYKNGVIYSAIARKEVICSAGTMNSPQVLMLSGIGPKEHLEELGIPLKQDLPVGRKLYDHVIFIGLTFTLNESIVLREEDIMSPGVVLDFMNGEGPLTSLGGVEALTFLQTKESKEKKKKYPDIELMFIGGALSTDLGTTYRKTFRVTDEIYDAVWQPLEDKPAFMVMPMLMHPKSFGRVELRSKSPFDVPKFYGNYFSDPDGSDIKTLIASIRETQRIVESPSMRRYDAQVHSIPIPGCEQLQFDSNEYWECAIRHLSTTIHHQIGTCRMGPKSDPEAVVDNYLRVHGVKNLRVADCSIIPLPLTAHNNIPGMMIGEKTSDLIKDYWLKKEERENISIGNIL
ncbi:hypothetical protein HHI36_021823 [Cryptolaemus montrouzieri]|uniref:Glucose-methanol-choline oxidoreductase N-terminal domain-containing protein n=1 Tax=Cryptolaemus montrouzieri TaxID=559131 RepID=A0ABD2MXV0_9CUCU